MKKALFFRKCSDYKELENMLINYPEFGQELEYEIIKLIKFPTEEEYNEFISHFLEDEISLALLTKELHIGKDGIVRCVLCSFDEKEGYLVYTSGFNYARYVAKWSNESGD